MSSNPMQIPGYTYWSADGAAQAVTATATRRLLPGEKRMPIPSCSADGGGGETLPREKTRGRPPGKRPPLTVEERRRRNAVTERARREEAVDAFTHLREALGQGSTKTRSDILSAACEYISSASAAGSAEKYSLADLRRQNDCLELQIEILQARADLLGIGDDDLDDESPQA